MFLSNNKILLDKLILNDNIEIEVKDNNKYKDDKYKWNDANDEEVGTKEVKLLVNPDPKSLWKNLDSNREDPYWKEDNASSSGIQVSVTRL